jgi:phosphate acetyltransferase
MPANSIETHSASKYDRLIAAAQAVPPTPTIVVHPCDETSLRGVVDSAAAGIIRPVLVGPKGKSGDGQKIRPRHLRFRDRRCPAQRGRGAKGVELIHAAKGEMLMKGSLHTDELMRSVTAKVGGLRTDRRISHVFVMDVPAYAETLFVTDAAINIFPDLDAKRDIIQNAIDLYTQAGFGKSPRVAILSAVETVTSKIPSTIEAAALCKMADRGQITGGCSTDRLPSTMPSMWKRRGSRESNPRLPAGADPARSRPRSRQHAGERISPTSPRQIVPASCSAPGCRSF